MKKIICMITCCVVFGNFLLQGQTVYEDYYDGQIYCKVKDDSEVELIDGKKEGANTDLRLFKELLDKYGVGEVSKPFAQYDTPVFRRTYKLWFANPHDVDRLVKDLEELDYMEYAEKVPIMRKTLVPNDESAGAQYHLAVIDAFAAFDLHQGGGAVIAIVDDAVDLNHEDLQGNLWVNPGEVPGNFIDDDGNGYVDDVNGYDTADNDSDPNPENNSQDHGTHVAGIAAASTNNEIGIASIGFNCKIMAVKGDNGSGLSGVWSGVLYALAAGADVINCSWGGGGYSQTELNIVNAVQQNGVVMVAAAGNDGNSVSHYPAAYDYVIAVANTNSADKRNPSSNYGTWVDIAAPGTNIYSTVLNNQYQNKTGTSMASPLVAGLCGLIKSFNPSLSPVQIEQCIKGTAVDIDPLNPGFQGELGAGRIDAYTALLCASPNTAPIVNINSNSNTICPGESVQFSDVSFYSPTSWSWSFPGGIPATSDVPNPVVSYPSSGNYDVTLTASNEFGTSTNTFTAYISVDPTLERLAYLESFEASFGTWTIENPDGGTTWELIESEGATTSGTWAAFVNNYAYASVGERDALVSPPIDIYGRSSGKILIDYSYRSRPFTSGDSLIVYVSNDGGGTYQRIFADADDGNGSFSTAPFYNGDYYPTSTDEWCSEGIASTSCLEIDISNYMDSNLIQFKIENYNKNVNNLFIDNVRLVTNCMSNNIPPIAGFDSDKSVVCVNTGVTFSDASLGVVSAWSWSFSGGEPATSSEPFPVITYPTPGVYEVELTVSNNIGTDTETKAGFITVTEGMPEADFTFSQDFNSVVCTNASSNATNYLWDFGDGNTSEEENPTHIYENVEASYSIALSASNGCGSASYSQDIQTTSTADNPLDLFLQIFPNPSTGEFTIRMGGRPAANAQIKVYDLLGREVHTTSLGAVPAEWTRPLDLTGMPAGTYIIRLELDGETLHRKVVLK